MSLRIALPKGRLLAGALAFLARAGVAFDVPPGSRDYRPPCSDPGFTGKLVKVRAIPQLIALGNFEVGLCGLDLVREADYEGVVPLLDTGLNPVRLVVALPESEADFLDDPPKRPVLIATEYVRIADRWALERNLAHICVQTWGSTEAYAPEDADVVFDCVETGATLAANDMTIVDEILTSSTWLVANRRALDDPARRPEIDRLVERLT